MQIHDYIQNQRDQIRTQHVKFNLRRFIGKGDNFVWISDRGWGDGCKGQTNMCNNLRNVTECKQISSTKFL